MCVYTYIVIIKSPWTGELVVQEAAPEDRGVLEIWTWREVCGTSFAPSAPCVLHASVVILPVSTLWLAAAPVSLSVSVEHWTHTYEVWETYDIRKEHGLLNLQAGIARGITASYVVWLPLIKSSLRDDGSGLLLAIITYKLTHF